jgi:glutathione S-transferase
MSQYTLYGTELSYYTGKVRAYLDWKGIAYEEVLPSSEVFKSILLPNIGRGIIPVVKTPSGEFIQDSTEIIHSIEQQHPERPMMPAGPVQQFASLLLDLFADEWLNIPALHYRWAYNADWAYLQFGKTSIPEATEQEQFELGRKNAQFFFRWPVMLGVTEDTVSEVERTYEAFLCMFAEHLEQQDYLFGEQPSFADFAFYGPLYAHLYRDPESYKIMQRVAPNVSAWVERCQTGGSQAGDMIQNDQIPDTLRAIMTYQMREQLPVLLASDAMLNAWAKNAEVAEQVPRGFEQTPVTIGEAQGTCLARSFPLWRLQAALDRYQLMDAQEKIKADEFLDSIGGSALKNYQLSHRLARKHAELVIVS